HKFEPRELTKPFFNKVANQDDITKMQYIDINFWLIGDILLKADKMSMAHSLEVRVPFLDKKVFEVAKTIPTKWKINNTSTKYAFRMAAKKHLPDVTADKKKLGFPVPIRIWLKEDDVYSMVKTTFASEVAKNFFNSEKLLKILNSHRAGKADNSRKIWTVYMFLVWYNEFF
ncbi:MAG: asparagine synthase C-terminal domain-containing protein, partial [Defluviitaleaceae bacterium]|nr:asparagine synthase C-terminal domain-containing protein [Defluviitaleaceae bacterium]